MNTHQSKIHITKQRMIEFLSRDDVYLKSDYTMTITNDVESAPVGERMIHRTQPMTISFEIPVLVDLGDYLETTGGCVRLRSEGEKR